MTLDELLKLGQSRKNIDQLIEMVLNNPLMFDQLWSIFLSNREPESRRAAWTIDILNEDHPFIQQQHIDCLIHKLDEFRHDGLKRHSLRILENHNFKPEHIGILASLCFKWLETPGESTAVKAYCIKILEKIAGEEPEIKRELVDVIEIQLDEGTPGFKNIGIKTIQRLQK
jgi:hypothetical protein